MTPAGGPEAATAGLRFSDADIRPPEFNEGKQRALENDLAWLRERRPLFRSVPCPACDGDSAKPAFAKYGFDFVRCEGCRTVYMNPRATPEILDEFYNRSELYAFWGAHIFPASEPVRVEKIHRPRVARVLEFCRRFGVETGTLADAGAGYGSFCAEVARQGYFRRVLAIEPNRSLAESMRSRGVEVMESPVMQCEPGRLRADVITAFEVIEHLHSPRQFLEGCRRLMSENSLLVVTCPNYEGFDILSLGSLSENVDAEHINLFNPASLPLLAERCGYEVLETLTPGELDADLVRQKALQGAINLEGQPFLEKVLLREWDRLGGPFQDFLKSAGLSSHLWMVARPAP